MNRIDFLVNHAILDGMKGIINPDYYGTTPFENRAEEFYHKFQKYIPVSKLQESRLWSKMVEAQKERLICEIIE